MPSRLESSGRNGHLLEPLLQGVALTWLQGGQGSEERGKEGCSCRCTLGSGPRDKAGVQGLASGLGSREAGHVADRNMGSVPAC